MTASSQPRARLKVLIQVFVQLQDGCHVATSAQLSFQVAVWDFDSEAIAAGDGEAVRT